MNKVRIVTDSTCDLSKDLLEQYKISMVPLKVIFGDEVYQDGIEMSAKEFYQRLPQAAKLPTTSQPAPGEFASCYESLAQEGCSVISIHISGELSGTVRSAELGGSMVPELDLHIVDSKTVSSGLALIVIAAAKAAIEGKTTAEILSLVESLVSKSHLYFVLDTLDYLHKGGRIGRASALLGNLLNIKPIMTFKDGVVTPVDKVRGRNRAFETILNLTKQQAGSGKIVCGLLHSDDFSGVMKLHERVVKELDCAEIQIGEIGPVIGTYAGPGGIGLAFYTL
ncbi:MAG: DegV family protein [Carboxydocellales bacterium]